MKIITLAILLLSLAVAQEGEDVMYPDDQVDDIPPPPP